jgi:glucose-6-phosphate 1-dehydrogenase
MPTTPLRERPSWKALEKHHAEIGGRHLRDLFAEDPNRGKRLCAEAAGLAERARLVVEKPFGRDLASARELNARLRRHFDEARLFRVDHYLGKEPVEDLLVLRFANTVLEPLWNRSWVQRIEITMAEDFDVADRGLFYDSVGAVRYVVQNHLLQVLGYLMMEVPDSDSAEDQRDAKQRLYRAVRTVDPVEVVRGQYDGYRQTAGVAADSTTETYVAMTLHVDNWQWVGVPVCLRAGKALPVTLVDVVVVLRAPPRALFYCAGQGLPPPNRIRLRLQPDGGVTFALLAKRPGGGDVATEIPVSVDFRTALGAAEQPYERILADALAGDPPPLPTRRKRLARDLMAGNGGWHGPGPARP